MRFAFEYSVHTSEDHYKLSDWKHLPCPIVRGSSEVDAARLILKRLSVSRSPCLGPAIIPEHPHPPTRAAIARTYYCLQPSSHILKYTEMSNKPSIPSWQRVSAESPITTTPETEQQLEPAEQREQSTSPIAEAPVPTESDLDEPENVDLLEQAKRFLDDSTIRDAPREKKVAFLESKGVSAADIETLLGVEVKEDQSDNLEEVGQRVWATVSFTCSYQLPYFHHIRTDLSRRLRSQLKHLNRNHNRAISPRSSPTPSSLPRPRNHHLSSQLSAC
jgi:hypothetical protein